MNHVRIRVGSLCLLFALGACGGARTATKFPPPPAADTTANAATPLAPDEQPLPLWSAVHKRVLPNVANHQFHPSSGRVFDACR